MADYRLVHCKMWSEDDWFAALEPRKRLLWIYLFTNDDASLSGLYVIRDEKIALETGLDVAFVHETLAWFASEKKIEREKWVVWVKKMRKYQNTKSEKIQTCIRKDVNAVSNCAIKRRYMAAYNMDTVSQEYVSGIDVSDSDSDSDSKDERGASDDARGPLAHPLVWAYGYIFHAGHTTMPTSNSRYMGKCLAAARQIEECKRYVFRDCVGLMIYWQQLELADWCAANPGNTAPPLTFLSKFLIAKIQESEKLTREFNFRAHLDTVNFIDAQVSGHAQEEAT